MSAAAVSRVFQDAYPQPTMQGVDLHQSASSDSCMTCKCMDSWNMGKLISIAKRDENKQTVELSMTAEASFAAHVSAVCDAWLPRD